MSFPPGTEMFQFPGFASYPYVFRIRSPCGGVAPFGYLWIKTCSRFPKAFRSVPRPSSPPGAKASTECPFIVQSYTHITARLERDLTACPPCTGTIHRNHIVIIKVALIKSSLGTRTNQTNQNKNPAEKSAVQGRISCNIHGHHNRNHCIIMLLNTRKPLQL